MNQASRRISGELEKRRARRERVGGHDECEEEVKKPELLTGGV
jgi:hypothetical protein